MQVWKLREKNIFEALPLNKARCQNQPESNKQELGYSIWHRRVTFLWFYLSLMNINQDLSGGCMTPISSPQLFCLGRRAPTLWVFFFSIDSDNTAVDLFIYLFIKEIYIETLSTCHINIMHCLFLLQLIVRPLHNISFSVTISIVCRLRKIFCLIFRSLQSC